jgi:hypothetical protein
VKEGPSASNNNRLDSDRFVENGAFLRLQNLQLGYALPPASRSSRGSAGAARAST